LYGKGRGEGKRRERTESLHVGKKEAGGSCAEKKGKGSPHSSAE